MAPSAHPPAKRRYSASDGNEAAIDQAMDAIATAAETHSDMSADADYRRQLIRTLGREVTASAFARARG